MFLQHLFNSASSLAPAALVALGFGLIYCTTGAFHFAHGATFTVAAYVFWYLVERGAWLPVAFAAALASGTLVGLSAERFVYAPLVLRAGGRGRAGGEVLVSSLGVLLLSAGSLSVIFGRATRVASVVGGESVVLFGATLGAVQRVQRLASSVCIVLAWLFVGRSTVGLRLRALAVDPELFSMSGYSVYSYRLLAFTLGSLLCSCGACLTVVDVGVDPESGLEATLIAATAAIVGSESRLFGALIGVAVVTAVHTVTQHVFSSDWAMAAVFAVLLGMLSSQRGSVADRRKLAS